VGNLELTEAEKKPYNGRDYSLSLTLPPLGMVVFKKQLEVVKSEEK